MRHSNAIERSGFAYSAILTIVVLTLLMVSLKYTSLHSSYFDLGVFSNHLHLIYSESDLGLLFSGHAQPYLLGYAYIFSLAPKGYGSLVLVITQALALMLPVFWLIRHYSWVHVFAYLSFFPLWFNLLNDFHVDHLSVPLLFYFFISIEKLEYNKAFVVAILLALVKEVFALQTIACGVYLILSILKPQNFNNIESVRQKKYIFLGVFLIVFGFFYFYLIHSYVFPAILDSSISRLDSSAYSWLGLGVTDKIINIASDPIDIVKKILSSREKVIYILALFGSLGFVSLFSYRPLLIATPILLVSLLSLNSNYYGLGHHYTAGLIAPLIYSFIHGLSKVKKIFCRNKGHNKIFFVVLILGLTMSNIALSSSPISRLFWSNKIWQYSYNAYLLTDRVSMIKDAITEKIPNNKNISVSVQNTLNWELLSTRGCFLVFPQGLGMLEYGNDYNVCNDGKDGLIVADYVVLDVKRPWFLLDQGCQWLHGKCTDKKAANYYLKLVNYAKSKMTTVYEKDGFLILKHTDSPESVT